MFVLFNKDKNFIGYSPDIPPQVDILKIEIPEDKKNLNKWKWVGNFDSGKMVSIFEEGYPEDIIAEEKKLFENICKKYPLGVQLSNIIKQVKIIAEKLDVIDDNFLDMSDQILRAIDLQDKRLKYSSVRKKIFSKNNV